MRILETHDGGRCPPKNAVNNLASKNGVMVKNVEFTEPHSHVFNGYTSGQKYGAVTPGGNTLQFHEPNKVDFAIEAKQAFEVNNKHANRNTDPTNPKENKIKHLLAGGIAGCVASTLTCPLDVIKTRQQSSWHAQGMLSSRNTYLPKVGRSSWKPNVNDTWRRNEFINKSRRMQMSDVTSARSPYVGKLMSNRGVNLILNSSILQHYRYIVKVEGVTSLWKGLGPTLVGVVPSRAIYFYTYSAAKKGFAGSEMIPFTKNDSGLHLMSAGVAGFFCTTATSPLWVVKTKLQLHRNVNGSMSVLQCCRRILKANGIKGFYRGITASYAGILETVLHFVIYEKLKLQYQQRQQQLSNFEGGKRWRDYGALMVIAAVSKTTATSVAYPHEVVRTRLREETMQRRYRGFFQTLTTVAKQEGTRALYRGLGTQMIRQVPNMAIVMGTYELIIDAL